ncbi:MAG: hypothetical protein M1833_007103 [Piccolia ochrophora]|nr:MAG: hypothetical protein M1833_007103 [Piccolia ochrophora]
MVLDHMPSRQTLWCISTNDAVDPAHPSDAHADTASLERSNPEPKCLTSSSMSKTDERRRGDSSSTAVSDCCHALDEAVDEALVIEDGDMDRREDGEAAEER